MVGENLLVTEGNIVGARIELGDEFQIGRATSNDEGHLGDDPELSRYHAKISRQPGDQLVIEDIGSANGTFLNGRRVIEAERLMPGDTINVGTTTLAVLNASGSTRPAARIATTRASELGDQVTSVTPAGSGETATHGVSLGRDRESVPHLTVNRGSEGWNTRLSATNPTGGRPRKIVAESQRAREDTVLPLYQPDLIGLRAASGGFNCVVEVAARYCRRKFGAYPPYLQVPIPAAALEQFLINRPQLPRGSLHALTVEQGTQYELLAGFARPPAALRFEDPHRVHVTYRGGVALVQRNRPGQPSGRPVLAAGAVLSRDLSPDLIRFLSADWIRADDASATTIVAYLGPLTLDVRCDYVGRTTSGHATCDVAARLPPADVTLSPPGAEARLLLDEFVGSTADTQLREVLGSLYQSLTPPISVVGMTSWEPVLEFPDQEVRVFHVGEPDDQAVVAAFDLRPGCHGFTESVQQFLCGSDYGVISDEWVVQGVLKHKWRHGGFARRFTQSRPVRIKRDDREEDASVDFSLSLEDLSVVAVECDANTATDYIRLGGPATGTPLRLRLQDGTVLGPDQVDLGGLAAVNWTVFTDSKLNPRLSADAQMRQWQETAYRDGYRHLARPFGYFPEGVIDIDYVRVEGAIKHVFFLGSFSITF